VHGRELRAGCVVLAGTVALAGVRVEVRPEVRPTKNRKPLRNGPGLVFRQFWV
jgi:hypothetical protein